ncbi:ABC transporter substrate-binding protein [Aliidiomarina iranensis]|uniref:ABC transporter substrate-binding protein n=1 Tax=Aliidiomarina iranensis TaxID=1434071 RepID=A0A432VW87_9GAMM|nr:ABC transporter substrate-binding protein [Aliidiomarina iranensis]RUO20813.1 ABC transporter substrate-binding protein [Aliidiomarina iranensis]
MDRLRNFLIFNALLTVLALAPSLPAAALQADTQAERIEWVINTAPPFHIVSGPLAGFGICDVLIDIIDESLPDLESNKTILPQTRITQQFDRNYNQCFPCMIHRPASSSAIYTNPTHFYYPHGIITTAEHAKTITTAYGNPVNLSALILDANFQLGYPAGRRYPSLQHIIDGSADTDITRVVHTGENATVAILAMIKSGRIDYTIEYQILNNFDKSSSTEPSLEFIPIAETEGSFVLGAIGCTNNEWGQNMVRKMNTVLPEVRQHPRFLEILDLWFRDTPDSEPYRELLRNRVWQSNH